MKKKFLLPLLAALSCTACAFALSACADGSNESAGDDTRPEQPAHTHSYTDSVVAPDCTGQGYTLHTCECGESYKDTYVNALGHNYESYASNNDATCTADGTKTAVCTREGCNERDTVTDADSALGHNLKHRDAQAATCATVGWNAYDVCTRCDYSTYSEIAKTSHGFTNYICTTCYSVDPQAPDTQGLTFALNSDGQSYSVTGQGTATGEYLKIPATYNGKPVTAIGDDSFNYTGNDFTALYLPEGIKKIGDYAFCGENFKSISLPDSLTELGTDAFESCEYAEYIYFGTGLTKIPESAFNGCYMVTALTIPDCITEIDKYAFFDFNAAAEIYVPASVTYISEGAFASVNPTCKFTIESENYIYGNGMLFNKDKTCLLMCQLPEEQTKFTVPDGVTKIGAGCFFGNENLEEVVLPAGLKEIGVAAFSGCTDLSKINLPEGLTVIEEGAFGDCTSLEEIELPQGLKYIGECAFGESALTQITIPYGVTHIGGYAFEHCNLTSLEIPDSVTSVGERIITSNSYNLYNVYESGNYLGNANNPYLVLVDAQTSADTFTIHEDTKIIADSAFTNARDVTSLTIPDGVIYIGEDFFWSFNNLQSITVGANNSNYYVSGNCLIERETKKIIRGFGDCIIPEGITTIGKNAFSRCTFTSITIPDSVTSIGVFAFYECGNLESVIIGKGVKEIKQDAFWGCYRLAEVYNLSTLDIFKGSRSNGAAGYYAFNIFTDLNGQSKLSHTPDGFIFYEADETVYLLGYDGTETNLILPANFDGKNYVINGHAFYNNSHNNLAQLLAKITIPAGVTKIGGYAFQLNNISKIIYNGTKAEWDAIEKETDWDYGINFTQHYEYTVECSDGKYDKTGNRLPG